MASIDEAIGTEAADAPADGDGEPTPLEKDDLPPLLRKVVDKVGKIDESRITSAPEYLSGDEPTLYSNLRYSTVRRPNVHGNATETVAVAAVASSDAGVLPSAALLCGTALGCGLLALPTAVGSGPGYLPSVVAACVAWGYMTVSALLTAELLLNRAGETGRPRNVGLLELYGSYLGPAGGRLAGMGFLIVSYLVVGVYLSEGGDQLMRLLEMGGHVLAGGDLATASGGILAEGASSAALSGDGSSDIMTATFGDHSMLSTTTTLFDSQTFLPRALFAAGTGTFLFTAAKFNTVQKVLTHVFVPTTLAAFVVAVVIGLPTADLGALIAPDNQHPDLVLNTFPLFFMGWTYHGVVPRVVYDLEGDKGKITKAIVAGSTTALLAYLAWNAVILGNVLGNTGVDVGTAIGDAGMAAGSLLGTMKESSAVVLGDMFGPGDGSLIAAVAGPADGGGTAVSSLDAPYLPPALQAAVATVSELAVVTSLVGVVLGFVNEFNDAVFVRAPPGSRARAYGPKADGKWKVGLLVLLPPAVASVGLGYRAGAYEINNYRILDYTGIFGASVLFLILPALMAWQNRYADEDRPLTVRPMVPLGKVVLGSMYKAAGTLIVEQGLEKLGVFEFVKEQMHL